MKNTCNYCLLAFYLFIQNLNAQISGQVVDHNNLPIQDLMVLNSRTLNHTHTDAYGNYLIEDCIIGDTLQFSFLGYTTQLHTINNISSGNEFNVRMEESSFLLSQVNVTEPIQHNLALIDIRMAPVRNSQEFLRKVPGLFIAQHAGGGKAEQIFLRGFDIDHGTDIAISVDNIVPVNMVSHAHGQGYADLHFIIPETIKKISFDKGSYDASKGNFATAAYVDFELKDKIENNVLSFETGQFETNRLMAMVKLFDNENKNAYAAAEYATSDGYFEHPQDFKRFNGLFRMNHRVSKQSSFKFSASHFQSRWNASGQVPQRAIDAGLITRFGSLDADEGGITGRSNAVLQYFYNHKSHQSIKLTSYYSRYDFELHSNFTFFLNDPINGDQIRQKEQRNIFGLESILTNQWAFMELNLAIGARIDDVNHIELSNSKNRITLLERKALGDLNENNIYSYLKINWSKSDWEIQLQARGDYYFVKYLDKLSNTPNKYSHDEFILSPKINVYYHATRNLQLYARSGLGFHSNDTRLLKDRKDSDLLTKSINLDIGFQYKIANNVLMHAACWYIDLEDELVYVGDEAIVESSGHTTRKGIEAGIRWEPFHWLSMTSDASYTIAKNVDALENQNYIPLASKWSSTGSLTFQNIKSFSLDLRYRHLGDRPANEDYSIVAKGHTLFDGILNYDYKNITFSLIAENIFNVDWNEAQFATLSKMQNELQGVEEIHFTPGTPSSYRIRVKVNF